MSLVPTITLTRALVDPNIFGATFGDDSFWTWRVVGKLIDGIELTEQREIELFETCTGRSYNRHERRRLRRLFILAGRRAGKDRFFSAIAVWRAALCANWSSHISAGEGAVVIVVAKDRRQAAILRNYCTGLLRAPLLAAEVVRTTGDLVEFRNGGSIEVHANDAGAIRGRSAIAVLGSEACHWTTLEHSASSDEEVAAAAEPSLAMCPDDGIMLLGSSVHRRRGLMFKRYRQLWANDDADALVWLAPSQTMNPALPKSVVTRALADDAPRARAEYLSQWRDDIADFVTEAAIRACVTPGISERPRKRGITYFAFADPSGGSSDSFAAAVGHVDAGRDTIVLDAVREVPAPFSPEMACAEIASFLKSYGLTTATGDRYSGAWVAEQLGKFGITYKPSDAPKSELYLSALSAINSRRLELIDHARMIGQFTSLERRPGRNRDFIDHPEGSNWHDDCANVAAGIAHLGIAAPRYTLRPWADADADDPAVARMRRAIASNEKEWGWARRAPKPAWDIEQMIAERDARAQAAAAARRGPTIAEWANEGAQHAP
jgi:hypothetical protein